MSDMATPEVMNVVAKALNDSYKDVKLDKKQLEAIMNANANALLGVLSTGLNRAKKLARMSPVQGV